jgi:xanthine dehydrogenase small subunit
MTTQSIHFYHHGAVRTVSDAPTTRTVLQYLREDRHCTGTKEGCAEGDCGACTVVIGDLGGDGQLTLKAVNACVQLLPTLDGRALFSVEDLAGPAQTLHPVQQAMVDCHGSQCGFCTPGFVMSMWALYQNHDVAAGPPSRCTIDDTLSGNLCRCTGYRPIVDATVKMFDYPRVVLDTAPVVAALHHIRRSETLSYTAADVRGAAFAPTTFHAPVTLKAFAELRLRHPAARILAGSTDIGLWVTKQFRALGDLLYLGNVAELKRIERTASILTIGAAVSLEHAYAAMTADYPELGELWRRFASLPIRNAGTLGGNVANGSPIGDSMPVLIALGASLRLRRGEQVREVPLDAFYLAYQKTALAEGEFVETICLPRPVPGSTPRLRTYKVSKRYDQDISAVCAAFALQIPEGAGQVVSSIRIAFGGMAATPKRAAHAEAILHGQAWSETRVRLAMAAMEQDYQPLSDMRASGDYRLKVARNLLWRFYLETRTDAPLASAEVNAFAYRA